MLDTLKGYLQHYCLQVFGEWNRAELESFLIEITRDILKFHDTDGTSLIDKMLDTAGQV